MVLLLSISGVFAFSRIKKNPNQTLKKNKIGQRELDKENWFPGHLNFPCTQTGNLKNGLREERENLDGLYLAIPMGHGDTS